VTYGRVAVYENSGDVDDVVARRRDGLVPVYRQQPGFRSFLFVDGGETIVSLSQWDDERSAAAGAHIIAEWVRTNLAPDLALRETVLGEITTPD
jgi:hypothetical protein